MRPCVCNRQECYLCRLYYTDARYRALWDKTMRSCKHLGDVIDLRPCETCRGKVLTKIHKCHHPAHTETTIPQCHHCPDFEA
jgi:hypothetical protein